MAMEAVKSWITENLVRADGSVVSKEAVYSKYMEIRRNLRPIGSSLDRLQFQEIVLEMFPTARTIRHRTLLFCYKDLEWSADPQLPITAQSPSPPPALAPRPGAPQIDIQTRRARDLPNTEPTPGPPITVSQHHTPASSSQPARRPAPPRTPRTPTPAPLQAARPEFGAQLARLKSTVPTLRRVPKGARISVAHSLKSTLDEVLKENAVHAWEDLLLFPFAVLAVPEKSDGVSNLTTWVKANVRRWEDDRSNAVPHPRTRRPPKQALPNFDGKKVEAKLADGDVRGALRLLESEDVIAPYDQATHQALLAKHPPHPEPTNYPEPLVPPPNIASVSAAELRHGVKTFPPGSAGGLDSLRPQILKDLLSEHVGDAANDLATVIGQFIDLVLRGDVPEAIRPLFFGASLTPLRKKCGGIRPIACGCTWRRLAAKILLSRISGDLSEYLAPHQLGVGVKGGSEIGAHCGRAYFNAIHDGLRVFLKLDFWNAFNELRRDSLLQIVREKYPAVFPHLAQAYGAPSHLYYGEHFIESRTGIFQGDPFGPACFALAVQKIIEALENLRMELNLWFLDDSTLGDKPNKALEALRLVIQLAAEVGLRLNAHKSELAVLGFASEEERLAVLEQFRVVAPGIIDLQPPDTTLLGSPLTMPALQNVLVKKTEALQKSAVRLNQLSAHSAFFLLRASVSLPRLIYFLRCAPAFRRRDLLVDYDAALKATLEDLLNCSLSLESWLQSSLPVKCGGLGVRQAVHTAIPCFLASVHACLEHSTTLLPSAISLLDVDVEDAIDEWGLHFQPDPILPSEDSRASQEQWEGPLIKLASQQLVDAATSTSDQARILASSKPESGIWLNVLPSPPLGTLLDDESFRIASALRLGCSICQPHTCPCGAEVEDNGFHGLSCKRSAGRHSRHAAANDVIARALRSAEVPNTKEPAGCSRADGRRPDGLTLSPWSRGKSLVWDFTCVDTFAPSHLAVTSVHPGGAGTEAAERKRRKYDFLCDRFLFVPVAVETAGVWDQEGLRFLREVGVRIAAVTGEKRAITFLLQRMSLAVVRGNVASVLGTLPRGEKFEEIFLL